jgi:hypothetical protein
MARFRCKDCARTFNALTKTPMARLRKKPQWLANAVAMIAATSVARAAEIAEVNYTTAFRWRHRFLGAPALDKPKKLEGIVEADETFIRESFKGRRADLGLQPHESDGQSKAQVPDTIAVLIARDRRGATIDAVLPRLDAAAIEAAIGGVLTPDNRLVCDGGSALCAFAQGARIPVELTPAAGGPAAKADIHIDNVVAYRDRLQQWLRRFHGVATKNLPNYLGWRRALEAWGPDASPENWILGAVGMGPYQ